MHVLYRYLIKPTFCSLCSDTVQLISVVYAIRTDRSRKTNSETSSSTLERCFCVVVYVVRTGLPEVPCSTLVYLVVADTAVLIG